jgi:hypothetical protein
MPPKKKTKKVTEFYGLYDKSAGELQGGLYKTVAEAVSEAEDIFQEAEENGEDVKDNYTNFYVVKITPVGYLEPEITKTVDAILHTDEKDMG